MVADLGTCAFEYLFYTYNFNLIYNFVFYLLQIMSEDLTEINNIYDVSPVLHDVSESHPFYYAQDVDGWLEKVV